MTGIRSRARQLSLSLAGILVLVVLVGPGCVPQGLRADAASRLAGLTQYFDTALVEAWDTAFPLLGLDSHPGVSASHNSPSSHDGAPVVLTGGKTPPSAAAREAFIETNGPGLGSFTADYGTRPAWDSTAGLLDYILKDRNLVADGGLEAFAGSAGGGNDPASSRGAGDYDSSGTGASTNNAAPASLSRPSSNQGTPSGSAPSHSLNSEGTSRLANIKPDAHQDRVTGPGNGLLSVYEDIGASLQVASSDEPGGGVWSGGPRVGGFAVPLTVSPSSSDSLDPTTGDLFGQSLNGLDDPLQGGGNWSSVSRNGGFATPHTLPSSPSNTLDPTTGDLLGQSLNGLDDPLQGSVIRNDVNGGTDSDGGDGNLLDLKSTSVNDAFDKPVLTPEPHPGTTSSVPEPRSLVLLSLGLGAIILWRKFRVVSLNPAIEIKSRRTPPRLKDRLRHHVRVLRRHFSAAVRH
jgi:hypothetical protein